MLCVGKNPGSLSKCGGLSFNIIGDPHAKLGQSSSKPSVGPSTSFKNLHVIIRRLEQERKNIEYRRLEH